MISREPFLQFARESACSQLRAFAGDVLYKEGMPATNLYLIREGEVDLFLVRDGVLVTPGRSSDILESVTRATVMTRRLKQAGLPYIVVLTDPTTGGVTASYAMLGDIHIAEPGALIGFAGQRVSQDTIREQLPEGFQRAEYLHKHGMVDMVVPRRELKATLASVLDYLTPVKAA